MDQTLAVWLLILLALSTAGLPFWLERPLLVLPWAEKGEDARPSWLRGLESLVFFVLLIGLHFAVLSWIGGALLIPSDPLSLGLFLGKLLLLAAAAVLVLGYPGWRDVNRSVRKSFVTRMLEVVVLYLLVGTLGLAFEANIGNPFPKNWEFYAITLSLYLVLAYPGFVFRYLLRKPR